MATTFKQVRSARRREVCAGAQSGKELEFRAGLCDLDDALDELEVLGDLYCKWMSETLREKLVAISKSSGISEELQELLRAHRDAERRIKLSKLRIKYFEGVDTETLHPSEAKELAGDFLEEEDRVVAITSEDLPEMEEAIRSLIEETLTRIS